MLLTFDDRTSDSPFVERIWRSRSLHAGTFSSIAMSHWEMVVTRYNGKAFFTVRGPESKATPLHVSSVGAEWLGIRFKVGTMMPQLPASGLVDGNINLPDASSKAFWLQGTAWQFPAYDNADIFIGRLVREGLLIHNPVATILDTVHQAGYADQPHLTKSLKYFIGKTPAQIMGKSEPEQLSFLYKTTLPG
jgi:hypothetical protein